MLLFDRVLFFRMRSANVAQGTAPDGLMNRDELLLWEEEAGDKEKSWFGLS